MSEPAEDLSTLTRRLEEVAGRLREGGLDGEEAAAAIEECARLAAAAGAELERQARAPGPDSGGGEPL